MSFSNSVDQEGPRGHMNRTSKSPIRATPIKPVSPTENGAKYFAKRHKLAISSHHVPAVARKVEIISTPVSKPSPVNKGSSADYLEKLEKKDIQSFCPTILQARLASSSDTSSVVEEDVWSVDCAALRVDARELTIMAENMTSSEHGAFDFTRVMNAFFSINAYCACRKSRGRLVGRVRCEPSTGPSSAPVS